MRRPLIHILLALSLLLAVNYYWNSHSASMSSQQGANRNGERVPVSYIDQARSRSFSPDGTLSDILEAERIEQFGYNGYAMLTQPRLYAHSADDRTWSASADRGRFESGRERLLLRNNVLLVHDQTGTRLASRAVNIYLDRREAESSTAVTITQGDHSTRANGMLARLNEETITLGPDVESVYAPLP